MALPFTFNDQACHHVGRTEGFLNGAHQLTNKNGSQIGLPKTTSAGDTFLQSVSGVFLG